MKTFMISLLAVALVSQPAGACEWSEGISENSNGSYNYTRECHIEVGKTLEKLDKREQQVQKLNKALELKDLTIDTHKKRVREWKNTAIELEDRINTIEDMQETQKWIWFGVGVLATSAAVYGAGQLR